MTTSSKLEFPAFRKRGQINIGVNMINKFKGYPIILTFQQVVKLLKENNNKTYKFVKLYNTKQ